MGRVGRKLIERGIDGQPVASATSLVEVDLGPGVIVERTAHEGQAHTDAGRDPDRTRHGNVERGVLVAIADLRPQHLTRGRKADGRLLLQHRVDVAREALGSRANAGNPAHSRLGLRDHCRIVALEERFRREVVARVRIGRSVAQQLKVAQLDDVALDGLTDALQNVLEIGAGEIRAGEPDTQPPHVARFGDALLHRRHNRGRLQQVGPDAPPDRHHRRAARALADGHEPHGALFLDDLARVGHPGSCVEAGKLHVHPEGRGANPAHRDGLTRADVEHHGYIAQGRRIEERPLVTRARNQARTRQTAAQIDRQHEWFGQLAHFARGAASGRHGEREATALDHAADGRGPRSGIEEEVERPHDECAVHPSGRANTHRRHGAEERHLQAPVLLQLETIVSRLDLADREPDLFTFEVDAAPLRVRAVAREVSGQVDRGGLEVGPLDEQGHRPSPDEENEEREGPRHCARQGSQESHVAWRLVCVMSAYESKRSLPCVYRGRGPALAPDPVRVARDVRGLVARDSCWPLYALPRGAACAPPPSFGLRAPQSRSPAAAGSPARAQAAGFRRSRRSRYSPGRACLTRRMSSMPRK